MNNIENISLNPFLYGINQEDQRLTVRIIITDSATRRWRVPMMLPFCYTIKYGKPQLLRIQSEWTIELIRSLSDEQIGQLVRKTLNKLDEEKERIERLD